MLIQTTAPRDPLHERARAEHIAEVDHRPQSARFREHNELRYSLRAAFQATKTWEQSVWHIVSADVADPSAVMRDPSERLGLVPYWLDLNSSWHVGQTGQPPIYLHHGTPRDFLWGVIILIGTCRQ